MNFLKILNDNRGRPKLGAPIVAAAGSDEATVYLYEPIVSSDLEAEYWGGVSANAFVRALVGIDAKTIHLRINSPGGDVFGAQAIAQAIREHPANVVAHVDGVAASAASVVAIAADSVEMATGAFFMLHRAWSLAMGNAGDMLETAALLEKVDGSLADQYAAKTKKSVADLLAVMDAETWFTAAEALDYGLADSVASTEKAAPAASAAWNLSAYANAPDALKRAPAEDTLQNNAPAPDYASVEHVERQKQRLRILETVKP